MNALQGRGSRTRGNERLRARLPLLPMALAGMLPLILPRPLPAAGLGLVAVLSIAGLMAARTRRLAWPLLPLLWTGCVIDARLADRLDAGNAGQTVSVVGTVTSLPQRRAEWLEFLFHPDPGQKSRLPERLRVRWYRDSPEVQAGERWRLDLRLKPPRGRVNFQGVDPERGYFALGIGALATVAGQSQKLAPGHPFSVNGLRQRLRQRLASILAEEPAAGLILALALGDRSAIGEKRWQHLTATGTGHLLAISGLHIGLAAAGGFYLGSLLALAIPQRHRLRAALAPQWACAMLTAIVYAGLAGFGVSTVRALIMLSVLIAARACRRSPGLLRAWSLALVAVVLVDPLSPLRPGFWMSFAAVAVLLAWFGPRRGRKGPLRHMLSAQAVVVLALLPLGMFWFQRASGLGLVANLIAIPVVSFGIVPLVLGGSLLAALGGVNAAAWALLPAAWCAEGLGRLLEFLATHGAGWYAATLHPRGLSALLATLGALLLFVPWRLSLHFLALPLLLPVMVPAGESPSAGTTRIDLLDVGQGLAMTIATDSELMLYDTGPGVPGRWDLADSVVLPALRQFARRSPDLVVVSHGDNDHAAGLAPVRAAYPSALVLANTARELPATARCRTPFTWRRPGLEFSVLHPSPGLPYLGNLSSCVISVVTGSHSLLLPGDIDRAVEARLVRAGLGPHEILVAPHHGSDTSSSQPFVDALRPEIVLVAAGADNRFGFPRVSVTGRYRAAGARVASVSDCGALRLYLEGGEEPRLESARRKRAAVWRWPPAENCP